MGDDGIAGKQSISSCLTSREEKKLHGKELSQNFWGRKERPEGVSTREERRNQKAANVEGDRGKKKGPTKNSLWRGVLFAEMVESCAGETQQGKKGRTQGREFKTKKKRTIKKSLVGTANSWTVKEEKLARLENGVKRMKKGKCFPASVSS